MERIEKTTTSYQADGTCHTTSTVTVRELDEGEVGILLAGNNSILDPTLTPHMLKPVDYDISDTECTESENDHLFASIYSDDDGNDHWFPSLSKAFCIEEIGHDSDEDMETLYATHVVEVDDQQPTKRRKSRKTAAGPTWTDHQAVDSDSDSDSLDKSTKTVPLDVVYTLLND